MNNLYGDAMSRYFPYGGFKWVKNNNIIINRILNKKDNSLHGYFLEVDLDYPENLHEQHGDYSLAPEKIKINDEWLSPYYLEIKNEHNIKTGPINKLTPNLMSKNNCVAHYRNLQYHLSKGLIFKKVHEFKQSAWMKPYIDFKILEFKQSVPMKPYKKEKEANNDADKNHFKLLNNAVYGKTMENMGKRIKIRRIKKEKDFIKYASRHRYINHDICGKRLIAIHEKKD